MIISRYLAKEVYTTLLATVAVLLLIFLGHEFVRFMNYAAVGELTTNTVLWLLLLQLPMLLSLLLPLGVFLAILLAYGRMYADNEMTIFAACGIGPGAILRTTLSFAFIVMILITFLSLYLSPIVSNYANHLWTGGGATPLEFITTGRFTEVPKSHWIFYVGDVSRDKKHLKNIFAAEHAKDTFVNKDEPQGGVIFAESGYQKMDFKTDDLFLVLKNGYRYLGKPGAQNYKIIKFDEYGIRLPHDLGNWERDESSTRTLELWKNRSDKLLASELHWRIALPISVIVLTIIGTLISKVKPRFGRYSQLLPGILCYIIYINLLFVGRVWIKKGVVTPALGMWWVHGIMLILVLILFGYKIWSQLRPIK